jgi:GT2 family glycosyltransferase
VSGPIVYKAMPMRKRAIVSLFYKLARLTHLIAPMLQGGNFVLVKDAIEKVGGFNTEIDFYGEDTDTAVRLSQIGKVKLIPEMWAYSSSRRFESEGLFWVGLKYMMNYAWIWLFDKPFTPEYQDHR